jgi:hypothetical protein
LMPAQAPPCSEEGQRRGEVERVQLERGPGGGGGSKAVQS